MKIIYSEVFKKYPEITFGFSTKIGLDRSAPFNFNMSKTVTDDESIVDTNRSALLMALGLENQKVCFQKQIHSDIVTKVSENYQLSESDALYTTEENIALVISSADCVPIFLYDPTKKIIAGIHSGWKGTQQQILSKCISKIINEGVDTKNLVAYIGPCISGKNYEVGLDVANQFDSKYIRKSKNKYFLDLKSANFDMLIKSGVKRKNIEVSKLCSFEEKELLHSYRRDGKISGRAVGIICIRGEKFVTQS